MVAFPNCKINLGLNITEKRPDGFHNLETVFYPIPLKDALEIVSAPENSAEINFTATGFTVDGDTNDNLCIKAYQLLKKDYPQIPAVKVHLHKAVPLGAGLGGGSADAAFMLKLLDKKFKLNIAQEQLTQYALQLGSDCPFFLLNKPCLATGRGEVLIEIAVDLSNYKIVLINPGIHINTGWAFTQITPAIPKKSIEQIISQPIESWRVELKNDFEEPVFKSHPAIAEIKNQLYNLGAFYAAMSGSGSTIFGIFDSVPQLHVFDGKNYFIRILN